MARYTDEDRREYARRDAALIARLNTLLANDSAMTRIRAELAATAETVQSRSEADQVFLWQQAADRGYRLQDVASYGDWKKRGRHVRKGSKAFRVIRPAHTASTDTDGTSQVPSDARTTAALFDISDTQIINHDHPAAVSRRPQDDPRTEEPATAVPVAANLPPTAGSTEALALAGLITQVGNVGYRVLRQGDTTSALFGTGEVTLPAHLDDSAALQALAPLVPALLARPFAVASSATDPIRSEHPEPSPEAADQPDRNESSSMVATAQPPLPEIHAATTKASRSDPSDEPVLLDLGEYGAAEVSYHTNLTNGRTAYRVTAPHLAGTFTIGPEWPSDTDDVEAIETVPQGIDVDYGDEIDSTRSYRGHRALPSAPIVYGIEVRGGNTYSAAQVARGDIRTHGCRDTGQYTSQPLPYRSQARLTAVVRALVRHWTARTDVEELRLTSARFYAERRRTQQRTSMRELDDQIAELAARRDKHAAAAAAFSALITPEPSPVIDDAHNSPPDHPVSEPVALDASPAHDVSVDSCVECGEDRRLVGEVCQECRACRTEDCDGDSTHPDSWDGCCQTCADRLENEAIRAEMAATAHVRQLTDTTSQANATHGPQWTHVHTFLEHAAILGTTELGRVFVSAQSTPSTATAMSAAVRAAVDSCRDEAWRLATAQPCRQAAVALLVRDLLDPAHYRVLTSPWAEVLGPLHPDDVADATTGSGAAAALAN